MTISWEEFFEAVETENLWVIETYIKENRNDLKNAINIKDYYGQTALHKAAGCDSILSLERLLEITDIDINIASNTGITPLNEAAYWNRLSCVENLLLHPDIDVNVNSARRGTALITSICSLRSSHVTKRLVRVPGIDVNAKTSGNYTALHKSVSCHVDYLQALLSVPDIDVNPVNNVGETPLIQSAKERHYDHVALLLNRPDIRIDIEDNQGNTITSLLESVSPHSLNAFDPEWWNTRIIGRLRELESMDAGNGSQNEGYSRSFRPVLPKQPPFQERLDRLDADIDIPKRFLCPVSYCLMNDPRTLSNGNTYDWETIRRLARGTTWFRDPLTNIDLESAVELRQKTNRLLRDEIEEFVVEMEKKYPAKKISAEEEAEQKSEFDLTHDGANQDAAADRNIKWIPRWRNYEVTYISSAEYKAGFDAENSSPYVFDRSLRSRIECALDDYGHGYGLRQRARTHEDDSSLPPLRPTTDYYDLKHYFFNVLKKYNQFKPHSFISLFFNQGKSSYLFRPDMYNALYEAGIEEIRDAVGLHDDSEEKRKTVDRIIRHADKVKIQGSPESMAQALSAVWQTAYVLRNPSSKWACRYRDIYGRELAGSPSPLLRNLGRAMLTLGTILIAVSALTAVGVTGLGIPVAIGLGISGTALFASGAGLFVHGRRKGLSGSVHDLADSMMKDRPYELGSEEKNSDPLLRNPLRRNA